MQLPSHEWEYVSLSQWFQLLHAQHRIPLDHTII
jgi:hypothetical protein